MALRAKILTPRRKPHRQTTPRGSGPYCRADVPPSDWCSDLLVWLGGRLIYPADGQVETLSGQELQDSTAGGVLPITPACRAGG